MTSLSMKGHVSGTSGVPQPMTVWKKDYSHYSRGTVNMYILMSHCLYPFVCLESFINKVYSVQCILYKNTNVLLVLPACASKKKFCSCHLRLLYHSIGFMHHTLLLVKPPLAHKMQKNNVKKRV